MKNNKTIQVNVIIESVNDLLKLDTISRNEKSGIVHLLEKIILPNNGSLGFDFINEKLAQKENIGCYHPEYYNRKYQKFVK